jgi:hypothetical protein
MALKEKLEKLKKISEVNKEPDWVLYKEAWEKAVTELQKTIYLDWFIDFSEKGLMNFELIPVKRFEPYIGEYSTFILEITISENKFLVLEPVSAVTSEYDGKLEFYMRGNLSKKINILRKIIDKDKFEWLIVNSFDSKEHIKLTKLQLENIIEGWLQ